MLLQTPKGCALLDLKEDRFTDLGDDVDFRDGEPIAAQASLFRPHHVPRHAGQAHPRQGTRLADATRSPA